MGHRRNRRRKEKIQEPNEHGEREHGKIIK